MAKIELEKKQDSHNDYKHFSVMEFMCGLMLFMMLLMGAVYLVSRLVG